jgi:hypothetical protein
MFASSPFCAGYAFHAARLGKATIPACAAVVVSMTEVLFLVSLLVVALINHG